jgi:hypothetical protein
VQLFNMPDGDYKRFLSFLHKHDCRLPFQRYRAAPGAANANWNLESGIGDGDEVEESTSRFSR